MKKFILLAALVGCASSVGNSMDASLCTDVVQPELHIRFAPPAMDYRHWNGVIAFQSQVDYMSDVNTSCGQCNELVAELHGGFIQSGVCRIHVQIVREQSEPYDYYYALLGNVIQQCNGPDSGVPEAPEVRLVSCNDQSNSVPVWH